LIPGPLPGIVRRRGGGGLRPRRYASASWFAALALAAGFMLAGCGSKCPVPVAYSDAQLTEIQKARQALPKDSILHQLLIDYENERDDLRFCR
jgi:predicted small lipoprotein YifL